MQCDTPRKVALRKRINKIKQQNYRLKKSLFMLKRKQTLTTAVTLDNVIKMFVNASQCFSATAFKFLKSELQLLKNKSKGRRYSQGIKEIALSLYFYSPSAYRFCSKFRSLPYVRLLRKWLQIL